ncbi:D-alanyl-D-alanine carboxypeptidase [Bacillus sp. HMF5848]|uniref:D-alanyl-D-alanine carboxypeptidase family protein n=1 Tax=Bacillus sp. HMF5848 TaxID=2495421 RepID=UPI000F782AEE|nr:D-alanyl-D-alanine carboxypeptidase family protein [Bacillus sp. HMF5848]RSK26595.1 D-alanyl-D-alanine carboxypeptidase [Bacillus sp. HMF5848]
MKKIITIIVLIISIFFHSTITSANPIESAPTIISEAAIVLDANTGTVLYKKNTSKKMYPASLTKIATAIYAIEKGNLDDNVMISSNARSIDGTRVYLEIGEEVTLRKLVQGMLINSGNDAAIAIAEHLSGSVEQFSIDMNSYLKNKIGVNNTNFTNPHGLFNADHITTTSDLAKITQYAIRNMTFREIFGTKELKWTGKAWDTTIYTHHRLMREIPYVGVTGGKTGFVDESKHTLATTAKRGNLQLIVITLKASYKSDIYKDTMKLLDYGFTNFKTSVIPKGTIYIQNEEKFRTTDDIMYTYSKNEHVTKHLHEDGTLDVVGEDGSIISSFKLETDSEKKIKNDEVKGSSIIQNADVSEKEEYPYIYMMLFLFAAGFIYYKKKDVWGA